MHIPVLKEQVIEYLHIQPNENFIDCTLGQGGHAIAILEKNGPKGKVLGIDQDPGAISAVKEKVKNTEYKNRITFAQGNFSDIAAIAAQEKFHPVHGILFDLGLSSEQLEASGRGFSFQKQEPLDMRFNTATPTTAEKIANYWSRKDLERILQDYGEEQYAKEIANKIVEERAREPIVHTLQLVKIIQDACPKSYSNQRLHPATKTFQALRIAVNNELESLSKALSQISEILVPGGRVITIAFHSLEDRIIKNFFAHNPAFRALTKKPVKASLQETQKNPRSRSAILRAAQKI